MLLTELRVENLRNISDLLFRPGAGFNVLTGANGAGKTSILEAIYLLSHGRSFRTRRAEVLVRNGSERATVFGGVVQAGGSVTRLGLSQSEGRWAARIDGMRPDNLTRVLERCAVVCFEPGSHALISGSSLERREYLDWGVFHVEPGFAEVARRYRRSLRQRNAALRTICSESELTAWDEELAAAAEPLDAARANYFGRLAPVLSRYLTAYLPELGSAAAHATASWRHRLDAGLLPQLRDSRAIDRGRGHTTRGPHRADWTLQFERVPRREQLSRGQEKLCAIACMLAQAELYRDDHQEWPIVLLDDLPSELDQPHQTQVLSSLEGAAQVFITSTELPRAIVRNVAVRHTFHVERGEVQALL